MGKTELINSLRKHGFPENILGAFAKVQREDFVPERFRSMAYEDIALPLGSEQTISQPYTIAFMLSLLKLKDRQNVLEIGSGSGYVLALISEIVKNGEIYGVERIRELAEKSERILKRRGYSDVTIFHGDGSKGLKEKAPFDRILVSASAKEIPSELVNQLKIGGILVAPVRDSIFQIKKREDGEDVEEFQGFVFVPLIEE